MKILKHLLVVAVVLTLSVSVLSSVASPSYFVRLSAFAEDVEKGAEENVDQAAKDDDDQAAEDADQAAKDDDDQATEDADQAAKDDDDQAAEDADQAAKDEGDQTKEHADKPAENADQATKDDDDQGDQEDVNLEVDDDGVELKVEAKSLNVEDGTHDVSFVCTEPKVDMPLAQSLVVKDGVGKLKTKIALTSGEYAGCELAIQGTNTVLASFDAFTVDDDDVKEKRKEKIQELATKEDANKIHERHLKAKPASPGVYGADWNYKLTATGTAVPDEVGNEAAATADIDMSVWKSNGGVIILDVIGGTIKVEDQTYTVEIGYALYSIHHHVLKISALVSDDSGNITKLNLRGNTTEANFPMNAGESLDISFEGYSGYSKNKLGNDWELAVEGTVVPA